ncbi:hypothetical protein PG984_004909 [Apiospora sp. TS-2023a]
MEGKSFFSLPREIRDQIYTLCLVTTDTLRPLGPHNRFQIGLAIRLLRASKAVHAEACPVFYGPQNRFGFPISIDARLVDGFLAHIGVGAAHLGHVLVSFPDFDAHFRSIPSLRRVVVQLRQDSALLDDAEKRGEIEGRGWEVCTDDCREADELERQGAIRAMGTSTTGEPLRRLALMVVPIPSTPFRTMRALPRRGPMRL